MTELEFATRMIRALVRREGGYLFVSQDDLMNDAQGDNVQILPVSGGWEAQITGNSPDVLKNQSIIDNAIKTIHVMAKTTSFASGRDL